MKKPILSFQDVHAGYGATQILSGITTELRAGEFAGIVGSNGAGKSTLLKCVSGLIPLSSGKILLENEDNATLSPRERAKRVTVVPQSFETDYSFTVGDIVLMGRNPYLGPREHEGARDMQIVEDAMRATNTLHFRSRSYNELSGGERQRVIIARAIAQEPDLLLLDEPTSALDIHHQMEIMELIRRLNEENGMTVLAVLHDLNLASRFCSRLMLLQNGVIRADGTPIEVMTRENLSALYPMKLIVRHNPLFNSPEILPIRVLHPNKAGKTLHVHLIGGANGAGRLMELLQNAGCRVTAGVLNEGSDDWRIAKELGVEIIEEKPFTEIGEEKQREHLKLMAEADVIYITDTPFGLMNIRNLDGLENLSGELFFHKGCWQADYTQGRLKKRVEHIQKTHSLTEVEDGTAFGETLAQLVQQANEQGN